MSGARGGLGRGLGALIPTGPDVSRETSPDAQTETADVRPVVPQFPPLGGSALSGGAPDAEPVNAPLPPRPSRGPGLVPGVSLLNLPVTAISPNPKQPRTDFDPEAMAELVTSIREVGILQPVVVRSDSKNPGRYELIMGERRWRAAQAAGLSHVPAILRETSNDALLRDALLENLHRSQLNPLEEGAAYQQLLEEFGVTHDELATRIGRSRSQVSNTIRLLGLPAAVQRRVAAGVLSAGHARALLALGDPDAVEALAARIVAEGLSVRSVEELVSLTKDETRTKTRKAREPRNNPEADELAGRISDYLDTRVHVEWARAKSRLIVEVADADDLARVAALIMETPTPTPAPVPAWTSPG